MGVIIDVVRSIKEKYDLVLQLANKIDTVWLQNDMEDFVYKCFESLKPLSYKFVDVVELKSHFFGTLSIGEWIRVKSHYQTYGSIINSPSDFFLCIRDYGNRLKPYVRKLIRDDFSKLVDLTKLLQPYQNLLIKIDIPNTDVFEYYFDCREGKGTIINITTISAIGIETNSPLLIQLFQKNGKEKLKNITESSNLSIFEDIIDYMVELYKKAYDIVSKVKAHNDRVISEMNDIVAPYRISNSLK